jgi:hypothetical protein
MQCSSAASHARACSNQNGQQQQRDDGVSWTLESSHNTHCVWTPIGVVCVQQQQTRAHRGGYIGHHHQPTSWTRYNNCERFSSQEEYIVVVCWSVATSLQAHCIFEPTHCSVCATDSGSEVWYVPPKSCYALQYTIQSRQWRCDILTGRATKTKTWSVVVQRCQ